MITPEQLIADLQKQVTKLQEDLAVSEQNVKDFEHIAATWKKSYEEMEMNLKRKLANAEMTIKQMCEDMDDLY